MLKTMLAIAALTLAASSAQAFQLNAHAPTIHQLNPQPLPPGFAMGSGSGAGKVAFDSASPKLTGTVMALHNGTHIPK